MLNGPLEKPDRDCGVFCLTLLFMKGIIDVVEKQGYQDTDLCRVYRAKFLNKTTLIVFRRWSFAVSNIPCGLNHRISAIVLPVGLSIMIMIVRTGL